MELKDAKREFKKHYNKAKYLKEGGTAWQRETDLAAQYMTLCILLYNQQLERRYNG